MEDICIQTVFHGYTSCILGVYSLYIKDRQCLYDYLKMGKKDEKWWFCVCKWSVGVGHIH